jgi:hypothetical protein
MPKEVGPVSSLRQRKVAAACNSVQRRSKERAELFSMTQERARAGEKWIEGLAGDILQKTVAEV